MVRLTRMALAVIGISPDNRPFGSGCFAQFMGGLGLEASIQQLVRDQGISLGVLA
jgi:hypothetical protein